MTISNQVPFTLTSLNIENLRKLLDTIPPEPIGEWMRQNGVPPSEWVMFLPHGHQLATLKNLPDYVIVSRMIEVPMFINRKILGLANLGSVLHLPLSPDFRRP